MTNGRGVGDGLKGLAICHATARNLIYFDQENADPVVLAAIALEKAILESETRWQATIAVLADFGLDAEIADHILPLIATLSSLSEPGERIDMERVMTIKYSNVAGQRRVVLLGQYDCMAQNFRD